MIAASVVYSTPNISNSVEGEESLSTRPKTEGQDFIFPVVNSLWICE